MRTPPCILIVSRADSHGFCSWGLLVPRLRLGTPGSSGSASARAAAGRACQAGRARAEPGHEGNRSGAETVLAKGTKTGSAPTISLTEFSSLQARPGHVAVARLCLAKRQLVRQCVPRQSLGTRSNLVNSCGTGLWPASHTAGEDACTTTRE
jgi:hypothetical protein